MRAALVAFLAIAAVILSAPAASAPVDPRSGGLEVALGEWTLAPEARAIRPGSVTFVVTNRGRFGHGFRIRSLDSGGGGDRAGKNRFEARTRVLAPGETARLSVNLVAGSYRIDCFVEDIHGDHGDRGMQATLEVRDDAPLVSPAPKTPANEVRIARFEFNPSPVHVKPGTTVRWTNQDAARHTVSAKNGSFTSKNLLKGQAYSRKFTRAGTYVYLCAIHPSMAGRVLVR